MASSNEHAGSLLTHKTVTIVSFLLSAYFWFASLGNRHGLNNHHSFHTRNTPFTGNAFFVFTYWIVLFVLQLLFLVQYYAKDSEIVTNASKVTWHFTLFNLLHALWAYLFAFRHDYWLSEIVIVINFINLMSLYVSHKPYSIRPLSHWVAIHLPTTALPISWLLYALFWNGAVMVHAHKNLALRVLANVFIWDFLIVPVLFLFLYKDWGVGLSTSFLTWGLGVGQFFTRVIALQWIFAFIIAAIVFVLSVVVAVPSLTPVQLEEAREEAGHGRSGETAPLLAEA